MTMEIGSFEMDGLQATMTNKGSLLVHPADRRDPAGVASLDLDRGVERLKEPLETFAHVYRGSWWRLTRQLDAYGVTSARLCLVWWDAPDVIVVDVATYERFVERLQRKLPAWRAAWRRVS